MRHKVTGRTREILRQLRILAADQDRYLHLASASAQREWNDFQLLWPSDIEVALGAIDLSERDLDAMHTKVRRFSEILRGLAHPLSESSDREDLEPSVQKADSRR